MEEKYLCFASLMDVPCIQNVCIVTASTTDKAREKALNLLRINRPGAGYKVFAVRVSSLPDGWTYYD